MATNKTENPVAYPVPNAAPGGPYAGYSYTGTSGGTYAAPPAATYTATPVNAYPSVVAVGNPNQNFSQVQQQTPSGPPRGHWRDGLCDCFSNLWPSCGCNFIFHGAWLAAQISQKTGWTSFNGIMLPFGIIYIICVIISLFNGLAFVYYLPIIIMWIVCMFLRLHVVRHYEITTNGCFLEFLTAFFCCSCSLCQMARHVYGYNKVFAGDSDENVKDYYNV